MIIICFVVLVSIIFIFNIEIFDVAKISAEQHFEKEVISNPGKIVCILEYRYTTGPGWVIRKATDENLEHQEVVLNLSFSPRLLKSNTDYMLDYGAEYVVVVKNIDEFSYDNQIYKMISPHNVTIVCDSLERNQKIKDMTFWGMTKAIASVFIKELRADL